MAQGVLNKVINEASSETHQHEERPREGAFTRRLERQTSKIPSGGYLSLAIGSMLISAGIALFAEKKEYASFVGLWAPSLLMIGVYNKLFKLNGSDSSEAA
jgi:hypothetical protein